MSVIINVHDDLACRLQAAAVSRSLSVEEFAITILDDAVPPSEADQDWGRCNRRRLELIRMSTKCELTDEEQAELDRLQSCLDEQFESFDAGLLSQLGEMRQTLKRLSTKDTHE